MKNFHAIAVIIIVCAGCTGYSQKTSDIVSIEFSSLARGYSDQIRITKDSAVQTVNSRGEENQSKKEKINPDEWQRIIQSLKGINLAEIPDLKSPTMKRAYDGARHSTLSITTSNGTTYTHSFDDEEPHKKLMPLMKSIRALKE